MYQLLYIYSIPPDDWLKICPKHLEVDWRNKLRINSASSWFSLHGSIVLLYLFGIKRNCLRSGESRSLYQCIRRAIKQIVVIIGHFTFVNYVQNFIQHPAVEVNSIWRGNYWGSSMWISTQQLNYWSYIVHLSCTWEEMGIKRNSASPLYYLQEGLWFS